MDGRVLGSVVLLIRTFAAGVEFLQLKSIPTHSGGSDFYAHRQTQVLIALGFWFAVTMGYHVLTFGSRGSWLSKWMASPEGGGAFALATLVVAVPVTIQMLMLTSQFGTVPKTANMTQWFPNLVISVICAIWLNSAIRETPKTPPTYE